jgi:hypothetical protein
VDLTGYSSSGWHRLVTRLGHDFNREEISVLDSHPAEIKTAFALCRMGSDRVRACQREAYFPIALTVWDKHAHWPVLGALARAILGFDTVPGGHTLLVGARDLENDEIAPSPRLDNRARHEARSASVVTGRTYFLFDRWVLA